MVIVRLVLVLLLAIVLSACTEQYVGKVVTADGSDYIVIVLTNHPFAPATRRVAQGKVSAITGQCIIYQQYRFGYIAVMVSPCP